MNKLPQLGKGCYIWHQRHICGGDIPSIVRRMVEAKVQHVCIKVADGWSCYTDKQPEIIHLAEALRNAGIVVGAWGYAYLKWIPLVEAEALARGARAIGARYVLHDIEDRNAFFQFVNASRYINKFREPLPNMPTALNTYWKPSWHKEIPYDKIRKRCDFDAPQVYSRGNDPARVLAESKKEYARLAPALPFSLPCGDMYFEHGIKPKPGDVTKFMHTARMDPECMGVVMWSADQQETTPELWAEFAAYDWALDAVEEVEVNIPKPAVEPLYAAVLKGSYYVRDYPGIKGVILGAHVKGDRVTVFMEDNGWGLIDITDPGKLQWISLKGLQKL